MSTTVLYLIAAHPSFVHADGPYSRALAVDLVARQHRLRSCGVVQLFTTSHPERLATAIQVDSDYLAEHTISAPSSLAVDLDAITAALHLETPTTQLSILESEMVVTSLHATSSVETAPTRAVVPSADVNDGMHWDLFCFAIVVGQLYLAKRLKYVVLWWCLLDCFQRLHVSRAKVYDSTYGADFLKQRLALAQVLALRACENLAILT
jgi:hypothetical protein